MANELVVSGSSEGLRIAVLENKRLVEIHHQKRDNAFAVGDVYLGQLKRISIPLNAVFVDVGFEKDGFLHYFDLGPQIKMQTKFLRGIQSGSLSTKTLIQDVEYLPDIDKNGKISDVLKTNNPILVQIMKEAISTKGPRLSSQLSFAGQYIILVPFGKGVSVSRKFENVEKKNTVKKLLNGFRPKNVGFIVRTAAENVELEKLKAEAEQLYSKWQIIIESLPNATAPRKLLSEMDRSSTLLRDMLSIGFDAIYTDDNEVFKEIDAYLAKNLPEQRNILKSLKPSGGLFDHFNIEKQIKATFGKTVTSPSGSYLIIEHTEALHVIDVNSGNLKHSQGSPEENALRVNLDSAVEVARQLRLRDMGGIIVIDFIDQRKLDNRRIIYQKLKMEMERDRAKHAILPMSQFGLIQITRQRVRPEINIVTDETCPSCNGTGVIQPSILLTDDIEKNVDHFFRKLKINKLRIVAHPYLVAFLKQDFPSIRMRWFMKYWRWVALETNNSIPLTKVKYFDENNEEIKLETQDPPKSSDNH